MVARRAGAVDAVVAALRAHATDGFVVNQMLEAVSSLCLMNGAFAVYLTVSFFGR